MRTAANNPGARGRWIWLRAFMAGEFILLWDRADGAKSIPPEIIVQHRERCMSAG